MKSIDVVTSESLEETLSCDDAFLEYFNAFLSLPAFPQRLSYSRFTGTFHDVDKETVPFAPICEVVPPSNRVKLQAPLPDLNLPSESDPNGRGAPAVYGAKEDERERVLAWAKEHRLHLFVETQMYRELKLCKLLLRPLDIRRGSSRIRGYSRLSMGYATTTSIMSGPGGRMDSPSRALTSLDNQSSIDWTDMASTKYQGFGESRPASRAFSLPPNLGLGRTWSATAMYDTSATETSSTQGDNMVRRDMGRPKAHRRRAYPTMTSSRGQGDSVSGQVNLMSDSGLGTTAVDYAQSGTSAKTRNIATRADTLGVSSRWESEEGYSTRTPGSRARTAMTSSSFPGDGRLSPVTPANWTLNDSKYEGKSALRTADSPSKPHRATIVLPQGSSQTQMVRIVTSGSNDDTTTANTKTGGHGPDDVTTYDGDVDDDVADGDSDEFEEEDVVGEFLDFEDHDSSCGETETEIASIEKVHSMSLQHIKERIFRTKSGMDSFLNFVKGTAGEFLVAFWLDTEAFKDALARFECRGSTASEIGSGASSSGDSLEEESALRLRRHRLFRDILDRHKFILTEESWQQIREAQASDGLSYHVFARPQYDVLRRLRSYWLPRFVVHQSSKPNFKDNLATGYWNDDVEGMHDVTTNLSKLVSFPLLTVGYFHLPERPSVPDTTQSQLAVQTLESVAAQSQSTVRPSTSQIRLMSARSATNHRLMRALAAEPEAGYPFRNYIRSHEDRTVTFTYDFWMCLEYLSEWSSSHVQSPASYVKHSAIAFGAVEAYMLFNIFLVKDSPNYIKPPKKLLSSISALQRALKKATAPGQKSSAIISSNLFRSIRQYAINVLSSCLQRYNDHEIKIYIESREGRSVQSATTEPSETSSITEDRKEGSDSTSMSETTTTFSKHWYYDADSSTETDSASTMYSYDVERIKQLANSIRQKGAKKPQRPPPKKTTAARKTARLKTAGFGFRNHQASKVQFRLPTDGEEKQEGQEQEREGSEEEEEEDGEDGELGSEEDRRRRRKKKKKAMMSQHPNRLTFAEIKANKLLYTFLRKYISQCESVEIQNVMQMYQLCDALLSVPSSEVDRRSALSSELVRTYLHSTGPKQIAMPSDRSSQLLRELPNPSNESVLEIQDYVTPTLDQAAANFSLGFNTLLKEYKLSIRSDLGQHLNTAELALKTLTLKPSSKRRRALGKHSARQTPTSEHKIMFNQSLDRAKEGNLPLELMHFYKYLQGFGNQEGFPLIHNDLMFYVEVNKFLALFHTDYDLVMLKAKIRSIRDCFIDSQMQPTLQIDIKTGTAERLRRAMDAFVADKGREPHVSTLFDDSQHTVFNELLPFWAGFVTAMSPSEREGKKPILKSERMQKRRLEAFLKSQDPLVDFSLPNSQPKFDMKGIEFTFSVNTGIQWKAWSEASSSRSSTPPITGVIEVVKAPPISQRRIVRRSGFTIRKLPSHVTQGVSRSRTTPENGQQQQLKTNGAKKGSKQGKNFGKAATTNDSASIVSYTTSVC